jgi:hypothetical protein
MLKQPVDDLMFGGKPFNDLSQTVVALHQGGKNMAVFGRVMKGLSIGAEL